MKRLLNQLLSDRLNEHSDRKKADYKQEKELLKEYNGRQLLELLQNIDDQKSDKALIKLDKKNKVIMICNSGEPFSEAGLKSLTMAHLSSKDKTFIGNKGLGFRSLLNWIGAIYVKSENLSIEFSRENRNRNLKQNEKRAILSSPEWIDENNQRDWINNLNFKDEYITYIVVNYKEDVENDIVNQINEITKELLFFINHIQEIKIEIIGEESKIFKKNNWEIKEKEGVLPSDVIDEDADEDDKEYYQLKVIIPPKDIEEVDKRLFSYFPTNIKIDFPILVHATFDLDSSRNTIIDSKKNRYIVQKLAEFLVEIGQRLKCNNQNCNLKICDLKNCKDYKESNPNWDIFKYFDLSDRHKNEILDKYGFYKIFEDLYKKLEIYPCIDNTYKNIPYYAFYNNDFSDYMSKYSDIFGFLLKKGEGFSIKDKKSIPDYYSPKIQKLLNKVSKRIKNIDERIIFIKHIEKLEKDSSNSFDGGEKLHIFVNQHNVFMENMFWYDEIFEKLDITNGLKLNYLHKNIYKEIDTKWKSDDTFSIFDIEKNYYEKIINSDRSIQEKLNILYQLFSKGHKKPKISIHEIKGKYIRNKLLLKLYTKDMIINSYDYLEVDNYENKENFLLWLGAKNYDLRQITEEIISKNKGNKEDLKWSLNALMILKNESINFNDLININNIQTLNLNGERRLINQLFEYNQGLEKENIIANKEDLGLGTYSEKEIHELYKILCIKEFNYRTYTLEKLDLLKSDNLSFDKYFEILKVLVKLYEKSEFAYNPNTNIYIFKKKLIDIYINDKYTTKYFNKDILILDEIERCNLNYNNYLSFYRWLGIKKASPSKIIEKIIESNIDDNEKLKDLFELYSNNQILCNKTQDTNLKVLAKDGTLQLIKTLYLNNEKSKYCDPKTVMREAETPETKDFYKWLKATEPSSKILKDRYLELLSSEEINIISFHDRKKIINLLYELSKIDNFEKIDKELYLINIFGEIKKSTSLYKKDKLSEKYGKNSIIDFDNNLDIRFLDMLSIKNISPIQILEKLLSIEKIDFKECFEIKKEYSINNSLSSIIQKNIKIKNRVGELKPINNLFLEKKVTPFYTDSERVAEYSSLNLDIFESEEIDKFLLWLGANEYIKYQQKDNKKMIFALNRIKRLSFENLIKLIEKENILANNGALNYLKNSYPEHKYWILNSNNIQIIKPKVKYENNEKRIKILKDFGIKENFDSENASELIKNLYQIENGVNYAPEIYLRLYNENIKLEEDYKVFTRHNNNDNKELFKYNNLEVCYLQDYRMPQDIREQYIFIDLPINLDIEKVEQLFRLKKLPSYQYEIHNFKELETKKYEEDMNKLKPYFLVWILGNETNHDIKKDIVNRMKNLNIKYGSFDCYANNKKIEMNNYDMLSKQKKYYIFTENYDENYFKNNDLYVSIQNILLTEFDEYQNEVEKMCDLFQTKNFDSIENKFIRNYSSNILEQMKNLLNPKQEIIEEFEDADDIEIIDESINSQEFEEKYFNNDIKSSYKIDYTINNQFKEDKIEKQTKEIIIKNRINPSINSEKTLKSSNNSNYDINLSYNTGYIGNDGNIFSNPTDTIEAGRQAEEIVKEEFPNYKHVSGYAECGSDFYGYDFIYTKNDLTHYVEVKNFSNKHFYVTENELKQAQKHKEYYHFYLVDKYQILDIGNPFKEENILKKILK